MSIWRDPIGWWEGLQRPLRHASRPLAALLMAVFAALMVYVTIANAPDEGAPAPQIAQAEESEDGDGDLALYARISDRVIAGEDYYEAALAEQRASNYPTTPFVTVRQPTLAMTHRWIGAEMLRYALFAALPVLIVLLLKRVDGITRLPERIGAALALLFGGMGLMIPQAPGVHEIVAGACLAFALLSYSPKRWWPALVFAGLALAFRELSLPFVLLWLAFALAQRRWREAAAIGGLLLVFAIGMYAHYLGVEAARLPGDRASPGWSALAGPVLPFTSLARLAAIPFVPKDLIPALMVLPLLGWLGLGGRFGLFAVSWFAGFLTAVALFARPENFYWVQLTLPLYLAGLAFVPRAIGDLLHAIRAKSPREPLSQS